MAWRQLIGEIPGDLAEEAGEFLEELGAVAVTAKPLGEQAAIETVLGEPVLTERVELTGLFPQDQDPAGLIPAISRRFAAAESNWRCGQLEDQNWSRVWMDGFKPLPFGERLWICPSWLAPPDPEALNIVLDPGMAFGTGTHASTALCLEWLSEIPLEGLNFVDYGSGSGILAIAAAKLGAAQVWAVDTDPEAWRVTRENAERNGVADRIRIGPPETLQGRQTDVLVANILLQALVDLKDSLASLLPAGAAGRIGLAGLLAGQVQECATHYAAAFDLAEPRLRDGWGFLHGRRR